jgi:hypothetical protein
LSTKVSRILARNRREPLVSVDNLMYATLLIEVMDRGWDFAARQLLDDLFQRRILLAHDRIEPDRSDECFLQLLVRRPASTA